MITEADLPILRDRLRARLTELSIEPGELEHSETRDRHVAILIDDLGPRKPGHVYRMTIAVLDGKVSFFVHIHGESKDLTTKGAKRFSKVCDDLDEVFKIVCRCWEDAPS